MKTTMLPQPMLVTVKWGNAYTDALMLGLTGTSLFDTALVILRDDELSGNLMSVRIEDISSVTVNWREIQRQFEGAF